jgi:hypothetical protein
LRGVGAAARFATKLEFPTDMAAHELLEVRIVARDHAGLAGAEFADFRHVDVGFAASFHHEPHVHVSVNGRLEPPVGLRGLHEHAVVLIAAHVQNCTPTTQQRA